jgi:hypothetical protein
MGITTNPTKRPSYGGQSGPLAASSNNLRSNQKSEHVRPDVYKLSTVIETRRSFDSGHGTSENIKSPNWYPGALPQIPPKEQKKLTKKHSDNESQRSLNMNTKTSSSSIDEDPMQIMVSKTFYITDEERSLAGRDPHFS